MRKLLCFVLLLFLYIGRVAAAETPTASFRPDGSGLVFRENRGQIKDTKGSPRPDVLYTADANGVQLFFQKNRVSYVYPKFEEKPSFNGKNVLRTTELYRMDWELIGANPNVVIRSERVSAAAGLDNYVQKHCPQGILGVKAYEKIVYESVYPNIDLVFYTTDHNGGKAFKYDFVVKPGGNVSNIRIRYSAHESIKLNADGSVTATNPLGRLDEKSPVSFQGQAQIATRFVVNGDIISFDVNRYDNSKTLVIDPLTVVWGSYYGGTSNENCNSLTIDKDGNPIFVGSTKSRDFPVNIGKTTLTNDYADLYVAKFNSAGARQWGTYYGGSDDDEAYDVATDPNTGNIVVAGASGTIVGPLPEGDFPTTPTAPQPDFGGGRLDAIIVYFNTLGAPVWSSYLGGGVGGAPNSTQEGEDQGRGVVINAQGEIVMVGFTICTDFRLAQGGSTNYSNNSGGYDAFITKWSSGGNLIWSTYYGSTLDDAADGIDIDQAGNFYITGYTKSSSFPIAGSAHQPTCNSCNNNLEDAFVLKFGANTSLLWGTFYGGSIDDRGRGISVSRDGSIVYVTGSTNSNNNISTPNSFQPNYGGSTDGFIVQLNGNTGLRNWASYLGDASTDNAMAVTQNAQGVAYVVGFTNSASFPTKFALQATKDNSTDGFLSVINRDGRSLRYSTFYGGDRADRANGVALDATGDIYVSGETQSTNLRQTPPIFQNVNRGGQEAFIVKLRCAPIPFVVTNQGLDRVCANAGCVSLNTNPTGVRFFGPGVQQGNVGEPDRFCPNLVAGPGTYTLKAYLADACNDSIDVTVTVIAVPTATVTGIPPAPICQGGLPFPLSVTLSDGTNPVSVTFTGNGIEGNNFFNPRNAGTFDVSGEVVTTQGCTLTVTARITVVPNPTPTIQLPGGADLCELNTTPIQLILNPAGGVLSGPGASGTTFNPSASGGAGVKRLTYTVTQNGCSGTATLDVTVTGAQNATITIVNAPPNNTFCILDQNSYPVTTNVPGASVRLNGNVITAIVPRNLTAGSHTLTVDVPQGQCFRSTTSTIIITQSVPSVITVTQPSICETQQNGVSVFVNPAGTLTAQGLNITGSGNNYTINPPFTPGTYTLTLVPNAGTCAAETTATFTVTAAPVAVIAGVTAGQSFCAGDNRSYPLTATANGTDVTNQGTWAVNGTPIGNAFIPSQFANLAPGSVTITFTPSSNVCAKPASVQVTLVRQVQSTILGVTNGQTFCTTNTQTITLIGNPAGTWSISPNTTGFNTANGSFVPSNMNAGSYTITLTPGQTDCALPASVNIIITQAQQSFITGITAGQVFCASDNTPKPLSGSPAGGTFSGPGVSNNSFIPSQAGSGQVCITYTPANTVCARPESLCVTVNQPVNTTITANPASPYCSTLTTPITFTVSPAVNTNNQPISGTWTINPATITINPNNGTLTAPYQAGSFTVTFTPNDASCARPSTMNIVFNESPQATASVTPAGPFCATDSRSYPITTVPANCTCSGPGVTNNQFTPQFAGQGTHTITCTPPANSCFRPVTFTVTVNPLTQSRIDGITNGQTFCSTDCNAVNLSGTPAGGTWTLTGASSVPNFNGFFQPCSLQAGGYNVTYTPPASACASPSNISFVITPAQRSFISGITAGQIFCSTDNTPKPLNAFPAGGTFSGNPGVVGNTFIPSQAGVGQNICIIYTPPVSACALPETLCVVVNAPVNSTITVPTEGTQFCSTDNRVITLTANPSTVEFYISGMDITTPRFIGTSFIPASYVPGNYRIEARYQQPTVCVNNSSVNIVITDAPTAVISGVTNGQTFCSTDNNSYPLREVNGIQGTFSGTGVVGGNAFVPSQAGVGSHTITFTPNAGACGKPTSVNVIVNQQTQSQITGVTNGQTFCNAVCTQINLTGTPAGGTWSLPGVPSFNGTFSACSLSVGSHTITYTPTAASCALPSSVSIIIIDAPNSNIAGVTAGQNFCTTDQTCYPLSSGAIIGTFSGPGVNGNQFCPRGLNGQITINFTPNADQCAKPATVNVNVANEIQAQINGLPSGAICSTTPCFDLTGNPAGGTFFYNGVQGGSQFCAAQFPNITSVTVRYVPAQGSCARETSSVINITPAQPVSITLSPNNGTNICTTATFTVTGSPAGGTFTIDGQALSGNPATITAAQYGVGNKTIIYRGTNGACAYAETLVVTLNPPPTVQIGGLQAFPYCPTVNVATPMFGTPPGGTFSGPGVSGNSFIPSLAGAGTHEICYRGNFRGCDYEGCTTVTVRQAVSPTLSGMAREYCIEDTNLYTFTATPSGGTFTGEGLNQVANSNIARFRPRNSTFQPGFVKVTYFGEFDGCPYYIDTLINILPSTPSSINPPRSIFCISDNNEYDFTVAPLGGRVVGQGVVNNRFNPSRAGVGFWRIDYIPQTGVGCNSPSSTFVTVAPSFLDLTLNLIGQNTIRAEVFGGSGNVTYTLNGVNQGTTNTFANLQPGTYEVCATDESQCATCKTIVIGQQTCDCPPNLRVTEVGIFNATLSWNANPSAQNYRIEYRISGSGGAFTSVSTTTTTINLPNLESSTAYEARLFSICGGSESVPCPINFTTFDCKAPDFFEAREINTNTANVEWDAIPGAFGYEIQFKELLEPESAYRPVPAIVKVGSQDTTHTFTGLRAAVDYVSRVRTICTPGQFSPWVFAFFTTENCENTALVEVKEVTCSTAVVTWTPVPSAFGYLITYIQEGGSPVEIRVGNVTTTTITGLRENTNYQVSVTTICDNGNGFSVPTFSEQPTFTTGSCGSGTPCPAPLAVTVDVFAQSGQATITWAPVDNAVSYLVEYRRVGTANYTQLFANDFTIDIDNLECPANYEVRVAAFCGNNQSPFANGTFSLNDCQGSICPIPRQLAVNVYRDENDYAVRVTWRTVVPEGHYYEVQYAKANEEYGVILPVNVDAIDDTMYYHISKLDCPEDYKFRVRTVCFDDSRSEWVSINFRINLCNEVGICPVPRNLAVNAYRDENDYAVRVTWQTVVPQGHYYEVQYAKANEEYGVILPVNVDAIDDTMYYHISKLDCPEDYKFRVRTVCFDESRSEWVSINFRLDLCNNEEGDCQSPIRFDVGEPTFNTIAVNWDAIPGAIGYQVDLKELDAPTYDGSRLTRKGPNELSHVFTGLLTSNRYEVRVRQICTVDANGNPTTFSPWTYNTGNTLDCEAIIDAPSVTSVEATFAAVNWTGSGGNTAYVVEYKRENDADWTFYERTEFNFSFLQGLFSCSNYEVRVFAVCGDGVSLSAPVQVSFTTDCPTEKCETVQNIQVVSTTNNSITISWNAPTNGATVEGYFVQYRINGSNDAFVPAFPGENAGTSTTYTINGLTQGVTYEIWVRAKCNRNGNDYSDPVPVIGTTEEPTVTCQPVNVLSVIGPNYQPIGDNVIANLSWGAVTNATSYDVGYRRPGESNYLFTSVTVNNASVSGLDRCTPYEWTIVVNCQDGSKSTPTNLPGNYTTPCSTGCDAPTNIAFTDLQESEVTVVWSATSNANQFRIRWRRAKDAPNQWLGETTVAGNLRTYTITGLEAGTIFNVELTTLCPTGGGPNGEDPTTSTPVTREVTTEGGVCQTPTVSILSGTITCNTARISWTETSLAREYEVQIREASGNMWSAPEEIQGGTYEFTGLASLTDYVVRVRSICRNGSEYSDYAQVIFRTPSCVPGEGSIWQITSGGQGWDESHAVIRSEDGGYVVTGYTYSWGAGEWDVYLAKYNAFGGKVWDKTFGTPNRDEGRSVRQTFDGGYIITGYTNGKPQGGTQIYVIKTDDAGNLVWERSYGNGNYQVGYDIRPTLDGGYIIAGTNLQVGAGARDVQLLKISADGAIEWQKSYGGAADDYGFGVVATQDGGYAVVGYTQSVGAGRQDVLVMKTSATGAVLWAKTVGGSDRDFGYGITEDVDGNIIATGYTRSFGDVNGDVIVAKFDAGGNTDWVKTFGNNTFDYANGLEALPNGDIVVTGATSSNGTDATFIRIDASGKLLSSKTYGSDKTDQGRAIIPAGDGGFIIAGQSNSFENDKNAQVYVVKTEADGSSCDNYTKNYPGIAENTPVTTPANVTNAIISGTTNSNFIVTSAGGSIEDDPNFDVFTVCVTSECEQVINLTVNNITGTSAEVTWTNTGASAYIVRFRQFPNGNFSLPNTVTTTSFTIPTTTNTDYEVEVVAVCSGSSNTSDPALVTFNSGAVSGCNAATNIRITNVTNNSAVITWTGVPASIGYLVRYREDGQTGTISISLPSTDGTTTLPGLKPATKYFVQVCNICASGEISCSLEYPFTTLTARELDAQNGFTSFTLYPNPTRGEVMLNYNATTNESALIQVMDVTGKVILTQQLNTSVGVNEVPVDLSGNAAGIYLLRFTQGTHAQTVKVVLQ